MNTKKICEIIKIFKKNGYLAYLVGGSSRDLLLSRDFDDIDLTTNAPLTFIKKNFNIESEEGIGLGSLKINYHQLIVEITLFRKEEYDYKSIFPKVKEFISDPYEDANRRDFTINAIYLDLTTNEIIDPFAGLKDLFSYQIRFIGDSEQRILEDPTRILRAIRLAYKLNFAIEEKSLEAILNHINELKRIKTSKFLKEIDKMEKEIGKEKTLKILNLYHIERREKDEY